MPFVDQAVNFQPLEDPGYRLFATFIEEFDHTVWFPGSTVFSKVRRAPESRKFLNTNRYKFFAFRPAVAGTQIRINALGDAQHPSKYLGFGSPRLAQ